MKKIITALVLILTFSSSIYGKDFSNGKKILTIDDMKSMYEEFLLLKDEEICFDDSWQFASESRIHSGVCILHKAKVNRKDIVVAVNAGHGTAGGASQKTLSHPDGSPKLTGGSTAKGAVYSTAVSSGMTFKSGLQESKANLSVAQNLKALLLENGYDVLMIRDSDDVQLDNVARTVLSNNNADIHIAIHFDGDSCLHDKGVFYCAIPEGLKKFENVRNHFDESERLGKCLVEGLVSAGCVKYEKGMEVDLTQTSYSTIPTVDIELGNQCTVITDTAVRQRAEGLLCGINLFFSE